MYRRIKNTQDIEMMEKAILQDGIDRKVVERIKIIVRILDASYGENRSSRDMGGYVLLFKNQRDYYKSVDKVMKNHHVNKDEFEYSDVIAECWQEELYLLSSDDALVLIHLKGVK